MINLNKRYTSASQTDWQGRNEGDDLSVQRWFQRIEIVDLEKSDLPDLTNIKGLAILGFSCDTGVGRNQGRQGSVNGPTAIRKICSNLPVHFQAGFKLIDAGSIGCPDDQLERSQLQLGRAVAEILSRSTSRCACANARSSRGLTNESSRSPACPSSVPAGVLLQ